MSDSNILELIQVTKTFQSGDRSLEVLREASFIAKQGESIAIVGPSGSGKTTLLGLCAGLDSPSSGEVKIAGESLNAISEDDRSDIRNRLVGFVFQNFQLLPTLTALENVQVPLELRGEQSSESVAKGLLAKVGLEERMGHYPVQLSGGEQQRVAIARAFINRPKILFADEPTGNLDGDTSQSIVDLLFELNQEAGTTLVLVTHDLDLARKTDRIIRINVGKVTVEQ
ncbi:MAG: ABC transporter ATP-binding protein [Opitutales bacterium]|jgi:putative ABC transport system ATP-binding protein|nr:ABC transporter ATP-binding protein [Opitutales bacterium]MDG2256280.1 ABC transporter ATP-binding protein [Opitutaceae bacterium]MBT5167854.1 ABC transporter ATP-binding protein [Opitutales bacterium]MBT5816484.1 ABC transporter ATP-binding protein [Opitutales bacterium]MBT6379961.1 ABC transporter ATP-binding protein [Opitutales bacterium]